jgi:hypothetical protein
MFSYFIRYVMPTIPAPNAPLDKSEMLHCWLTPTTGQDWPERLASLEKRAKDVGLRRVCSAPTSGYGLYQHIGRRDIISVDEYDQHMLFPREQPSTKPEYHGFRYMTTAELDAESALLTGTAKRKYD